MWRNKTVNNMIGRKQEQEMLGKALRRNMAQIIVVYGRRRVGKTFLVNEFFNNSYSFKHTAVSPVGNPKNGLMKIQIEEFFYSLKTYGLPVGTSCPQNWTEAFHLLQELLDSKYNGENQVVFIDELPWMDTNRAGFIPAFEHFCNDWCLARKHVKLIVCGSATSWIVDKLLDDKNGLYGRITSKIYVKPFTLKECRDFFHAEGFHYYEYDIVVSYMAFGGIPYYLSQFQEDLSVAQNIDALLFDRDSILEGEFEKLFNSQFANAGQLREIVVALGKKRSGMTRDEILKAIKSESGGGFSENLSALEKSRIINAFTPFGQKKSLVKYRLSDPFCNFYLHHVIGNEGNQHYWENNCNSAKMNSWLGLAFEDVVFRHIEQIKHCLGISGVVTRESSFVMEGDSSNQGMQVDLIIDRDDRIVNLCEIKFSRELYTVTGDYSRTIMYRISRIEEMIGKKCSIMSVIITTYGLKKNEYSYRFQKVVTMEDLFT